MLKEHNYARPAAEAVCDFADLDLLPSDFDYIKGGNDVWMLPLDADVDVTELLNLAPSSPEDLFSVAEMGNTPSPASKGSPLSDGGYESTAGSGSPESNLYGSESSSPRMSSSSSPQPPWSEANIDALLGDLQDAVKVTMELHTGGSSFDEASLAESSMLKTNGMRDPYSAALSEKRKRAALTHSDRISGPTAFLGNAVCWETGLQLTEEEKETLVADGCPVPTSLPLSADEEKALKLARRKIKNKISAQESRRKKKEFMDTMQQRVEMTARENRQLQQRLEEVEKKNQDLMAELHALKQDVARQQDRSRFGISSTSTHTTLLVLAVCFAFAFPAMYGSSLSGVWLPSAATKVAVADSAAGAAPAPAFDYSMASFRSRTLKQFSEFEDDHYDEINGSGGGALPSEGVSVPLDLLPMSALSRPLVTIDDGSEHAYFAENAVVVKENASVPIPA